MALLTVMAAEDGVCQGDDRDGILLLSKCGAWPSLPSHIWGERSLEFQDSRRGAREDLHIVLRDRPSEGPGKQRVDSLAANGGAEHHPSPLTWRSRGEERL